MKRILAWTVLLLSFIFILNGCNGTPATIQPDEPPSDVTGGGENEAEQTDPTGPIAPLTGLETTSDLDHPVIMTMINNHPRARPQTGLNKADIVFEILAEGQITRFASFFHSQTEGTIGPVRSARPYYLDLADGMDAVVAHAGGSPAAKERFTQPGYPSLDGIAGGGSYFWRADFRQAPHNLYTSLDRLQEGIADKGFADHVSFPELTFAESGEATVTGEPATKVRIVYGSLYQLRYEYDQDQGQYIRFIEGEQQIDRETDEPIAMTNVLIIQAQHQVLDDSGRRAIDVTGSGSGWLLQQGKVRQIEWQYEDGFPRPYADGQELPLIPGKTWINVIPEQAEVTF